MNNEYLVINAVRGRGIFGSLKWTWWMQEHECCGKDFGHESVGE